MDLSPVKISSIRIEDPLPFSLLGANGTLLLKKGSRIKSRTELEAMAQGNDSLFIDRQDAQALKRHQEGQMLTMLARDSKLANITQAGDQVALAKRSPARLPEVDKEADWPYLQEQAHAILRNGREAAFLEQIDRLEDKVSLFSQANPDGALLALIQMASVEVERYSATHAMLVNAMCGIAAREVLHWPADLTSALGRAALSMNIGMTELQDILAQQKEPLAPPQRLNIDQHPARSVDMLISLGLDNQLWLEGVRHHHTKLPGPLAKRAPGERIARLIQRADKFAAAISPRAARKAVPPGIAMKAIYFDENKQVDEAGAALIKAVGIYSPGTYVRLASQETAVVVRRGANTTTPFVAVMLNRLGMTHSELTVRDTAQSEFKILSSIPGHEIKVRPPLKRLLPLTKAIPSTKRI